MTDTPDQTPGPVAADPVTVTSITPEPAPPILAAARVGDSAITLDGTALTINGIRQDADGMSVLIGTDQWMAETCFREVQSQG